MELIAEDDVQGGEEYVVQDHDCEEAVPCLDSRGIGIELVPRQIFGLSILKFLIRVELPLIVTILI